MSTIAPDIKADLLRLKDKRLLLVLEAANIIPWEADFQSWRFTYVGSQAERILGYPIDRWYENDFWTSAIFPEDQDFAIEFCRTSSKTLSDFEFQYRMKRADGEVIWLHDIVNVEMVDGVPQALRGFMIDITAIKRSEESLRIDHDRLAEGLEAQREKLIRTLQSSEQAQLALRKADDERSQLFRSTQKLRDFLDAAPDATIIADEAGVIVFASVRLQSLFGYRQDEIVGSELETLIPKRLCRRHRGHVAKFLQSPNARDMGSGLELVALHKDGSEFPVEVSLNPVYTENRVLVSCAIRNITRRKALQLSAEQRAVELAQANETLTVKEAELRQTEKELRESESMFKQAARTARLGHWQYDEVLGCYLSISEEYARIFGYSVDEFLQRFSTYEEDIELVHPEDRARVAKVYKSSERADIEYRIMRADGCQRYVHEITRQARDEGGRVVETMGTLQDITGIKQTELNLLAANEALTVKEGELRSKQVSLRALTGKLIVAQENERRRIGRELHDDLTQQLAVLAINAGKLEQQAGATERKDKVGLRKIKERLMELSEYVQALSRRLHPSIVEDLGISTALHSLCEDLEQNEGILIDCEVDDAAADIPNDHALCIYRVAQEALRNIVKHSRATRVQVQLHSNKGTLKFQVRDNGIGFNLGEEKIQIGLGLQSMKERARLFGGAILVKPRPGDGTVISVSMPLS